MSCGQTRLDEKSASPLTDFLGVQSPFVFLHILPLPSPAAHPGGPRRRLSPSAIPPASRSPPRRKRPPLPRRRCSTSCNITGCPRPFLSRPAAVISLSGTTNKSKATRSRNASSEYFARSRERISRRGKRDFAVSNQRLFT
jgi:hypothetical protein